MSPMVPLKRALRSDGQLPAVSQGKPGEKRKAKQFQNRQEQLAFARRLGLG